MCTNYEGPKPEQREEIERKIARKIFGFVPRSNQSVTLQWESQNNRSYSVESSSNLLSWNLFATNLVTTTTNSPFAFGTNNVPEPVKFFRIYRVP